MDPTTRIVLNVDLDKETFKAFIEGIYNGFDKSLLLTLHGSKKLLALAQTYQLEEDLVSGLFSDITLWPCLQYALESLPKKSKLLRKCEEVAKFDKAIYKYEYFLRCIHISAIIHILKLNCLPLSRDELKEFVKSWQNVGGRK